MYDIGTKICDMHYGEPTKDYDDNPIKVVNTVKIRFDDSDRLLQAILHKLGSEDHKLLDNPYWKIGGGMCLDNKYAMVVGQENGRHQAIWTWDDRYLGMMEFEVLEKEKADD